MADASVNRQREPDEDRYPWLSILLDAYHTADTGIEAELPPEERKRGQKIACHKGCSECCKRPSVPLLQIECQGISWYVTEVLTGAEREIVKMRMMEHNERTECPFLVNRECAIYAVRPLACRQFFVFGRRCKEGEDPWHTRRGDIWSTSRRLCRKVAFIILPFYGIAGPQRQKAFEEGTIFNLCRQMHELDWTIIVSSL